MRNFIIALALLGLTGGLGLAGEETGGGDGAKAPKLEEKAGLVAHYFKDPAQWEGNWTEQAKPTCDPKEYTFREYRYSRIEPLVNHLFIRRGWFSVRWVGNIKVEPGLGNPKNRGKGKAPEDQVSTEPVEVKFILWCDDGARLFIDGEKLIDDWRPCSEKDPESKRTVSTKLTPGPHKIVVEYFQGESLEKQDRDPAKLYWQVPAMNIGVKKPQIVPASHFFHTDADLQDYEPSSGNGNSGNGGDEQNGNQGGEPPAENAQ